MINGLGRHEYYLTASQRRYFQVLGWADWMQTFITLMFTKISICLFLLRIVDTKNVKIAMYSLIGCLILFTSISVCLFLGVCRPLKAYWDVGVTGTCLSNHQVESVVLAQGSKLFLSLRSSGIAKRFSPFRYHGSHLCRIPNILLAQPSGQIKS